jgi:hypothetical protein
MMPGAIWVAEKIGFEMGTKKECDGGTICLYNIE